MSSAPASTMPWIEFAADISGVCRVAGTLPMTSMPTSNASTKIVRSVTSAVDISVSLGSCGRCVRGQQLGDGGVDDLAVVRDDDPCLDLVGGVDLQCAVADHVQQQRADVTGKRVGGSARHGGGEVLRPDDRDAVVRDHVFPWHRA